MSKPRCGLCPSRRGDCARRQKRELANFFFCFLFVIFGFFFFSARPNTMYSIRYNTRRFAECLYTRYILCTAHGHGRSCFASLRPFRPGRGMRLSADESQYDRYFISYRIRALIEFRAAYDASEIHYQIVLLKIFNYISNRKIISFKLFGMSNYLRANIYTKDRDEKNVRTCKY